VRLGLRPFEAWLPVMQNGGEDAMIARWLQLAGQEADASRRADLGLALVFAEAAGCGAAWNKALEGWNVVESQVVKQWQDEAERKAMAATLLRQLQIRFGELPAEIGERVRQAQKAEDLDRWLVAVATATTLEQFRHNTGL
jgi:hypothetical protein